MYHKYQNQMTVNLCNIRTASNYLVESLKLIRILFNRNIPYNYIIMRCDMLWHLWTRVMNNHKGYSFNWIPPNLLTWYNGLYSTLCATHWRHMAPFVCSPRCSNHIIVDRNRILQFNILFPEFCNHVTTKYSASFNSESVLLCLRFTLNTYWKWY